MAHFDPEPLFPVSPECALNLGKPPLAGWQVGASTGPSARWLLEVSGDDESQCWTPQPSMIIRIAIRAPAFEAIARTLPFGPAFSNASLNAKGERLIWIERAIVRPSVLPKPGPDDFEGLSLGVHGAGRRP
jgi:hypothetical protein